MQDYVEFLYEHKTDYCEYCLSRNIINTLYSTRTVPQLQAEYARQAEGKHKHLQLRKMAQVSLYSVRTASDADLR